MSDRHTALIALSAALLGTAATHGQEKSQPVQLTSHPAWDYHPRWSPDGSMIAFTSQRNGSPSLWIMAADGTGAREIAGGVKGDYHIAWSPDGTEIAFDADGPSGSPDIWTISVKGGDRKRVTHSPAGDAHPAWSPDGSTIAFTSFRSGNSDIWTIPATGGNARQITTHTECDWHPRWSPDGSRIVFTSKRAGNLDIWTIPSVGGAATQVTKDPARDDCAYWSWDGSSIVFSSERSGNGDIWSVPAAGGKATRITFSDSRDGWPSWSPDGSRIAFSSDRGGNLDVWVVDAPTKKKLFTSASWPQWGGPNRDFMVDTSGLADKWPDDGPKRIWHRELGTGYSSIVVDAGTLYTMYRKTKKDVHEYTIALDAATGKTIWQHENVAEIPDATPDWGKEFTGPNATPLIVGDRLYTLGRNATLHCFRKRDGKVLWKHELRDDFGAEIAPTGYSCSPIVYGDTILIPVGKAEDSKREGSSLIAFDKASGSVVWQAQTFGIFHSSPILITLDGQVQYILCTKEGVVGLDPSNGDLLWEYPVPEEDFRGAIVTPVWNGKDMLQFSSNTQAYGIQLTRDGGKTTATQIWSSKKAPLGMGTPVLIGDMLVGSKRAGGSEIRPLMAVDIRTGKRLWLERAFAMATPIGDARKLILLDGEGKLALATATRERLMVHSQCQLTERYSFTAPTLVGTTMYVRDEKHIMALDLSPDSRGGEETR